MSAADILRAGRTDHHQLAGHGAAWVNEMPQYARRLEITEVAPVTTIYSAWAPFGSAEGDPVWMVQELVLDETVLLDMTGGIAGGKSGKDAFAFTWTGRAGHSYS